MTTAPELSRLFASIDTVLSLHFSSSTITPKLHDLCSRATDLAKKRVDISTFELILAIYPEAFKVVSSGSNAYDYGVTVPDSIPIAKFGTQLPLRKRQFEERLRNHSGATVKLCDIAVDQSSSRSTSCSPTKSRSPSKITKPSKLAPKNDLSKFLFKEKISAVETSKTGLSLLERIKLKEKLNSHNEKLDTPQMRYDAHIHSKMPAVYNILYELATSAGPQGVLSFRSFALAKVVSIVMDSFQFAISDTEVRDVILALESTLGHDRIQTLQRGQVKAIKVFQLDRELDLLLLTALSN